MRFFYIFLFILLSACASVNKEAKPLSPYILEQSVEDNVLKNLGDGYFLVSSSYQIFKNITEEMAEKKAMQNACNKALAYYNGVEVKNITYSKSSKINGQYLKSFASLSKQNFNGIILEKKVVNSQIVSDGKNLIKKIVLKVKIGKQKGEKDPYFIIDAKLNKKHFAVNDEIKLTISLSKNAYITVLNISSDGKVYQIFPNKFEENNFVEKERVLNIPNKNYKLRANLLKGKKEDSESFKILATKKRVTFITQSEMSKFNTYQDYLSNLLEKIVRIPKADIAEEDLVYFIRK